MIASKQLKHPLKSLHAHKTFRRQTHRLTKELDETPMTHAATGNHRAHIVDCVQFCQCLRNSWMQASHVRKLRQQMQFEEFKLKLWSGQFDESFAQKIGVRSPNISEAGMTIC